MKLAGEGVLLRIFIGESDKFDGKPLYKQIVFKAKEQKLAGATVMRGMMGFGANSNVKSTSILRLSEDLPLVIEVVDFADKIEAFLPILDEMMDDGLVTMEKVQVLKYSHQQKS